MPTSKRADRVWDRLIQSYGTRVAESYGIQVPKPWVDAIDDLSDEAIVYGLRKVNRDTPIHPPTLGQFVAACTDMPQPRKKSGQTIQEQLCAFAAKTYGARLHPRQFSMPWEYQYKTWVDDSRPKHLQNCAECIALVIPDFDVAHPGYRITVDQLPSYAPPFTYQPPPAKTAAA